MQAAEVEETNDFLLKLSDKWTIDPTQKKGSVAAFLNHRSVLPRAR